MKYIDADKLRAEIDAFYTKYKAKFHQNGDSYHLGIIDGLDMAERILDTLESEKPMQEDLEDEIDRVIADYSFTKTIDSGGFKTTVLDYAKIARHFFELGLNARKE